ncbi:DUF4139 domain-containing protein [Dyella nitratireducens]|uniref:DUF4139 domain-containing protein n=1 Tax=Dyella nitratireducens TaxID=1849580 RepID=A0ABQ1FLG1_9GAMM|nr:DUF4139 domain-containing protein [Dyella nitratireducens]GGA18851.1 hypothetical protein GCM10010981_03400 [Dyella nitratireducens]GLQ44599.1 hypothetical protein GCM10007902_44490 [Dyella nitratireducens]
MPINYRTVLAVAIATLCGVSRAEAADGASMTLYRSDSPALYSSSGDSDVNNGYAVVREQRNVTLQSGVHDLVLGDLPNHLDAEAMALGFPGGEAKVISQRLLLGQGPNAALTGLTGSSINVLGDNGQALASGTLLRAGEDGLVVSTDHGTTLIRQYAAVSTAGDHFPTGSSLRLRVDASRSGQADATLSYPTSGIGWRAAYVATLQPGNTCSMQFESRASIANRSGRDWHDTNLTLIAGEPNFAKTTGPRPMMMRAMAAAAPAEPLPEQSSMGDYRSYTLPAPVDLPDGSISQVPLYAARTVSCERTSLYENGGNWMPPQPMLNETFNTDSNTSVISTLRFTAFDSLPAGYLRVLTADRNGVPQFIGEGRINDTPKGSDATMTLGTAFDLRGQRERTGFHVDKAGRTMDEAFRITLTNAGESARTVTVREHPNRWREWTVTSSTVKPSKQTTDTLEFKVDVPANGKAVLDYGVRYTWTADVQPQS